MAIGKDEVVDVLSDFRLRSIRFSAGAINVNVEEYDRVADFVEFRRHQDKATKGVSMYDPPSDTLYLKDGDSRNDFSVRSGILHECTHVVSDINKADVDQAARRGGRLPRATCVPQAARSVISGAVDPRRSRERADARRPQPG